MSKSGSRFEPDWAALMRSRSTKKGEGDKNVESDTGRTLPLGAQAAFARAATALVRTSFGAMAAGAAAAGSARWSRALAIKKGKIERTFFWG